MKQGAAGEFPAHVSEFGLFSHGALQARREFWRHVGDGAESAGVDLLESTTYGGEAGIRTLDTGFGPYNGLANRRLQPLGHLTAVS
jgi:hypothetical protein